MEADRSNSLSLSYHDYGNGLEVLMATLYLTEQYSYVKLEGEALRIQSQSKGERSHPRDLIRIPLAKIDQVMVLGDVTLSTPALQSLLERRIAVHYFNQYGRSYGALLADWGKNSGLRLAQYQLYCDPKRSFEVARSSLLGKLGNMRTLLLRHARTRDESQALQQAAEQIQQSIVQIKRLSAPTQSDDRMHGLGPLLGLEGYASAAYYACFDQLLKGAWSFPGRVKRPPTDPINALLSFGYTVLTNQIVSLCHAVGLDPGLGMLHQAGFGKPALALDLIEPFRSIIVDSVVITMVNTGQISPNDFENQLGAYRLHDDARRSFIQKLEARLDEKIKHPLFGYNVSYRRSIELQARILAKYAQAEIAEYRSFSVR